MSKKFKTSSKNGEFMSRLLDKSKDTFNKDNRPNVVMSEYINRLFNTYTPSVRIIRETTHN